MGCSQPMICGSTEAVFAAFIGTIDLFLFLRPHERISWQYPPKLCTPGTTPSVKACIATYSDSKPFERDSIMVFRIYFRKDSMNSLAKLYSIL